ncbi:MAG: carbamoyl-phosphate synthase (glutamine-hydrolyzing) large subunit [Candidatus Lokiarchaeota archaeon]|nr:carbamoyl-phosphate synthase (glutamine-hydrolyzing) large subunit [Candidatus Lokiarchaeota archaeon]MBD3343328.1 carbamoyl-phosphate synthase (glutamine-hydrolyzing) large subunit [Candidatus Lokiarchaeota archaeon]
MPLDKSLKKVLVLGSGAVRIGQAGEFDYSGSQVLKALNEEGIETILINPNIATIQTDPQMSDKVYLLPITIKYVEEIIKKEKPDGICLSFGGQTGLNVGVELFEAGILDKYNVKVLGTPIKAIEVTEDRDLFVRAMNKADCPVCKSKAVNSYREAKLVAKDLGFPLMLRVAYVLGGKGSGIIHNWEQFERMAKRGLAQSRINQILIEESVWGWKEIEFEILRDAEDNCFINCSMENVDPCGIHTGDSIVVAPAQTLTDEELQMLRSASIRATRAVGVCGECNIQWALDPFSKKFRAIEINARLSRSSALASKATGYPLAYIAAKIAVGYTLPELQNQITLKTTANFEPATDYMVMKYPRWDLTKFEKVDRRIGPQMKGVGECMSIGRNFEEVCQKALRMLDIGLKGFVANDLSPIEDINELKYELRNPTDLRFLRVGEAIKRGISINEIYERSKIDKWFLYKLKNIVDIESNLEKLKFLESSDEDKEYWLLRAKRYGFSDGQIAKIIGFDTPTIRRLRKRYNIVPFVKQIDTLAGQCVPERHYLYLTYWGDKHDINFDTEEKDNLKKVIVLGSGTYRIGASVEFDWGSVNCLWGLQNLGVDKAIIINYNPETVSTDYDISDRLYFEELSGERVLDICELEKPYGVVLNAGGQIAQNLAAKFAKYSEFYRKANIKILGTHGSRVDMAEDRAKFSALLDQLSIKQPKWDALTEKDEAIKFAQKVGYPVLVRPSYVLSGAAMRVCYEEKTLRDTLDLAAAVSKEYPVVITKFFTDSREVECDGICDGENVLIGAIVEHIENAGVHSGDATMAIPPQTISEKTIADIKDYTREIALALQIRGPFNVQYLVKNNSVFVIECNLRSSRSMPYVSKTRGINLMKLAAEVIMGNKIPKELLDLPYGDFVSVKSPMFSFMRLDNADVVLGVEMNSTGEVGIIGDDFPDALMKSLEAAENEIPIQGGNVLISVGGEELKKQILPIAQKLKSLEFTIFATEDTAKVLRNNGIKTVRLYKVHEYGKEPNIMQCLQDGRIDMVINIPLPTTVEEKFRQIIEDEYKIRRMAVDYNIPVIINLQLANAIVDAIEKVREKELIVKSLSDYHKELKKIYW